MDCHNSFMVHDGFLFHKWGHKLVQHIQDTPMVVTSPSGSRRQGSLQVSWHRHISIAQWPGRNRPNGMVVECHAIDGGIWTTVVDVGSLSSVGGLDHEVHPRSAQNRHPATWCTPFISPSLMCRQGQGGKDRLEDIGSKIGRWLECQTENMIGYWMILDDILEWYIGHGLMVDVCPARTPRGSTGKVWKPWWKAGVLPGFLAGYEDINQEWSPIFFRHTWSYSHKPVLFGSFSCVIERC